MQPSTVVLLVDSKQGLSECVTNPRDTCHKSILKKRGDWINHVSGEFKAGKLNFCEVVNDSLCFEVDHSAHVADPVQIGASRYPSQ